MAKIEINLADDIMERVALAFGYEEGDQAEYVKASIINLVQNLVANFEGQATGDKAEAEQKSKVKKELELN